MTVPTVCWPAAADKMTSAGALGATAACILTVRIRTRKERSLSLEHLGYLLVSNVSYGAG